MEKKDILFEDNHLVILNKKPGEIVQSDKTGDPTMADELKEYIRVKYKKPGDVFMGIVHRIDRPVSGAVVFARTSKALERMNRLLQERAVKKVYWALISERMQQEEGRLVHYLTRNEKLNKSFAHDIKVKESKEAILDYRLIGASKNYSLLEIILHTGRHHQIRAQLAKIGCPIRGDVKYGATRANRDGSIHLHARRISFVHPVRKELIEIIAPTPDDNLWKAFSDIED